VHWTIALAMLGLALIARLASLPMAQHSRDG
jgi:hypothetical protein